MVRFELWSSHNALGSANHSATATLQSPHHHLTAICPGLPGWASTRRNINPLTPMTKKKKDSHRQQGPLRSSTHLGALSQRVLSDPIMPAYSQPKSGKWPAQINSHRLWISMLAVLVTVSTAMQNTLHPLSTLAIFWIIQCRGARSIAQIRRILHAWGEFPC